MTKIHKVRMEVDLVISGPSAKKEYKIGDFGIRSLTAGDKFLEIEFTKTGKDHKWLIPYEQVLWMECADEEDRTSHGHQAVSNPSSPPGKAVQLAPVPQVQRGRGRPGNR